MKKTLSITQLHAENLSASRLVIGFFILAQYNSITNASSSDHRDNNLLELLRTPPSIKTLVYKRTLFNSPKAFADRRKAREYLESRQTGEIDLKSRVETFALRYEPAGPGVLFRSTITPTLPWEPSIDRIGVFFGRYDTNWWELSMEASMSLQSADGTYKTPGGILNTHFQNTERLATEYLRLGMFEILPQSVRAISPTTRSKTGFSAMTEAGNEIHGIMFTDVSRTVTSLVYTNAALNRSRLIRFQYGRGAKRLPTRISVLDIGPSTIASVSPYCDFEVVNLQFSDKALPASRFDVGQFMTEDDIRGAIIDGNFYFSRGGSWVPAVVNEPPVERKKNRRMLIIFIGFSAFIALALFVTINGRNK